MCSHNLCFGTDDTALLFLNLSTDLSVHVKRHDIMDSASSFFPPIR
nr:MAG TPA: hypothetical protein [Caudoviricetes sp.]